MNSSARFSLPPRGESAPWNGDGSFSVARPALGQGGHARGEQEGAVGAGQHITDGLDGGSLGRVRDGRVGEVVLVGQVQDGLGRLGAGGDRGQIVEVAAQDVHSLGRQGSCGSVGPGQPGDVMSGGQKFIDGGGTDPSGSAGNEDAHDTRSLRLRLTRSG